MAYTGQAGVAGNLRFYWTALDASVTAAHLIGTATVAADLSGTVNNLLGVGTTTRSPYRFELAGRIDEVRLSGVAHAPETFVLYAPPVLADTSGDGIPDFWAVLHGFDPAADNALDDPDGDGIPNLLEFALGLDPRSADSAGVPVAQLDDDFLTLAISRNPDAVGLRFVPEVSADLVTWFSGEDSVVVLEDTPAALLVRDAQPLSSTPRRFMRLRIDPAP